MLTLDADWVAAFTGKAAVDVTFLVRIDMDATHSATWCLADRPVLGYPASVLAVEGVCATLDPLTRDVSVEQVTVRFVDDDTVRDVVAAGPWRLKHKGLTVLVGTPDLAEADYEEAFVGVICDSPVIADGQVVCVAGDARELIYTSRHTLSTAGDHPLELVNRLLSTHIGLPAALYDATTLDPTSAAYLTTMSHYNLDRRNFALRSAGIPTPAEMWPLIRELCASAGGTLIPTESGVLSFKQWDYDAATVARWTQNELLRVEHLSTDNNLVNRVTVEMLPRHRMWTPPPAGIGDWLQIPGSEQCFTMREDTDAQAADAYPGQPLRVVAGRYSDPWSSGEAMLSGTITAGALSLSVANTVAGFCGLTDWDWDSDPDPTLQVPAEHRLSAARPAYLLVDDEIIRVELANVSTQFEWTGMYPTFGFFDVLPNPPHDALPFAATFTVPADGRAQRGTAAVAHTAGAPVRDITAAVAMCDRILQRFRLGCPILRVETNLDQFAVQLADFVNVETDEFLSPTVTLGAANTERWEVIRKEPRWLEGKIVWTLCHVPQAAIGTSGWKSGEVPTEDHQDQDTDRGNNEAVWNRSVTSGMDVTAGAGLTVTVATGAVLGASTMELPVAQTLPLPASKDCYVSYSTRSRSLVVAYLAAGSAVPAIVAGEVRLARVITGAAAITSVLDLRRTKPLRDADVAAYTVMGDSEPSRGLAVNSDFGHQSLGRGSPPDNVEMVTGTWLTDADIDTTTVLEGVQSLCLKNTAVATQLQSAKCIGVQLPRTVGGNTLTQAYEMTAHVRADSVAAGNVVTLGVKWYTAADPRVLVGTSTIHNAAVLTAANTWEHKHGVVEAPATARYAKLYVLKAANAFNVYLDSWALRRAQYGFHVYEHDTAQALVNKAFTQITFDTEEYDHGGGLQLGTSTYQAYHTGVHSFDAVVCFTPSEVGALSWADLILYRNGAYAKILDRVHPTSLAVGVALSGGTQLYLTEGDLVTLYVYLDNATGNADTIPGQRYVWFAGCEGYGGY